VIVVNELGIVGQVNHHIHIAIRQKSVNSMNGVKVFEIDETLNELFEGERGEMSFENHLGSLVKGY